MATFLFNHEVIQTSDHALNTSALDWLRTTKGRTGTKEGCASGDCGACTVLIGSLQGRQVTYRSANACLLPMNALGGKHLLTIEALNQQDDLHPVQQAMLDCHGTQCGFCTPGFIMSLYALYLNHTTYPGRDTVLEALSGNLCRCTGYRPILDAAKKAFSYPRLAHHTPSDVTAELQKLTSEETTYLPQQANFSPTTLATFFDVLEKQPDARIFSGATDFYLEATQQLTTPKQTIYLGNIHELTQLEATGNNIEIGAAVSYSAFLPLLLAHYPEASEVFSRLGSEQIRNQGTLGGSLGNASPIGDPAPFLLAVNASLRLASKKGNRLISIRDFFKGYKTTVLDAGEIIQSIIIPPKPKNTELFFYKLSKRYEDDISAVCMALLITISNGRIKNVSTGFGGMAATPKSAPHLEAALTGRTLTEETVLQAVKTLDNDFTPMSDSRASQQYRQQAAKNLVMRAFYASSESTLSGAAVRIHHA